MKRHRTPMGLLAVAGLGLLPALACTAQPRKETPPEARETPPIDRRQGSDEAPSAAEVARDVKKLGRDVKDAAEDAADKVKDAAEDAAEKAKEAADSLGPKVEAARQLADVKMALMADPSVDASGINVDADEATRTIRLKGTVPTTAQKTAAERIARRKAEGWNVRNMLTVAAR